jgi:hypothetical protein
VDFDGSLSNLAGKCPNVTFTVGGTLIAADSSTDYNKKSECDDLRAGRTVSGEGITQANGTVKATKLDVKK